MKYYDMNELPMHRCIYTADDGYVNGYSRQYLVKNKIVVLDNNYGDGFEGKPSLDEAVDDYVSCYHAKNGKVSLGVGYNPETKEFWFCVGEPNEFEFECNLETIRREFLLNYKIDTEPQICYPCN